MMLARFTKLATSARLSSQKSCSNSSLIATFQLWAYMYDLTLGVVHVWCQKAWGRGVPSKGAVTKHLMMGAQKRLKVIWLHKWTTPYLKGDIFKAKFLSHTIFKQLISKLDPGHFLFCHYFVNFDEIFLDCKTENGPANFHWKISMNIGSQRRIFFPVKIFQQPIFKSESSLFCHWFVNFDGIL